MPIPQNFEGTMNLRRHCGFVDILKSSGDPDSTQLTQKAADFAIPIHTFQLCFVQGLAFVRVNNTFNVPPSRLAVSPINKSTDATLAKVFLMVAVAAI